jgi:hypothetical protein
MPYMVEVLPDSAREQSARVRGGAVDIVFQELLKGVVP